MWNPESVNSLADLLSRSGRADEAERMVNDVEQKYPEQRVFVERFRAESHVISSAQPAPPAKP
jgi:hypothetical protein